MSRMTVIHDLFNRSIIIFSMRNCANFCFKRSANEHEGIPPFSLFYVKNNFFIGREKGPFFFKYFSSVNFSFNTLATLKTALILRMTNIIASDVVK